ncbi:hypothetical protein BDW74DRAFT_183079 [Aspergillus multicolor]|uniref:uncharacterized protein n=1 Tax=Aspergillus multicolor TaxID=41759 RepID=UPI003CCE2F40
MHLTSVGLICLTAQLGLVLGRPMGDGATASQEIDSDWMVKMSNANTRSQMQSPAMVRGESARMMMSTRKESPDWMLGKEAENSPRQMSDNTARMMMSSGKESSDWMLNMVTEMPAQPANDKTARMMYPRNNEQMDGPGWMLGNGGEKGDDREEMRSGLLRDLLMTGSNEKMIENAPGWMLGKGAESPTGTIDAKMADMKEKGIVPTLANIKRQVVTPVPNPSSSFSVGPFLPTSTSSSWDTTHSHTHSHSTGSTHTWTSSSSSTSSTSTSSSTSTTSITSTSTSASTSTTTSATPTDPGQYGNYGAYGNYGTYANYGQYLGETFMDETESA